MKELKQTLSVVDNLEERLKKSELGRAVFHILSITLAMIWFYFAGKTQIIFMMFVGVIFLAGDYGRLRWKFIDKCVPNFLRKLMREAEKQKVSGTFHFILASEIILLLHLMAGLDKPVIMCSILFVAVGDPMARVFGKTIKSISLFNTGKTLSGAIAFFVCGFLASLYCLLMFNFNLPILSLVISGIFAMIVEVVAKNWDNFHVPLWTTLLLWSLKIM